MKKSSLWLTAGVLALFFGFFCNIVYQISHEKPYVSTSESATDTSNYAPQMQTLTAKLASVGVATTWPSNGSDDVMRVDMPSTKTPFDGHAARSVASDTYQSFVTARESAHVPDPANCIVHVYDDTGKQVAHASESGAEN